MKIIKGFIFAYVILFVFPSYAVRSPKTFSQAKKAVYQLYSQANHRETFYCQCRYSNHKQVDLNSCGYIPRKSQKRASRTEIEHIVPTWAFGYTRACWREPICVKKNGKRFKGRKCCERIDPVFRKMASDMHNLVPAVGEVNGDRSHFTFTMLGNQPHQYGACKMIVDFGDHKAEPPAYTRGFIARTYYYMHEKYQVPISDKQAKLFAVWNQEYPPTAWEIQRNKLIARIQPS